MYTSLLIVKKLAYAWMYYPNGLTTGFAISKGYITGDEVTGLVQIVEQGKTKRPEVLLSNIIVQDEFSGGATMTFSSFADLQQQLTIMNNPLMVGTIGGGVLNPDDNKFISKPGFTLVSNLLTVNANWIWKLVGITYTNPTPVDFLIDYSEAGKSRIEYIIPNNTNGFDVISGPESTGIPIAPQIPDNGLYVTFYQVTDNMIISPQEPITGEEFVKKLESQDFVVNFGLTTVVDFINMFDDRSSISLTNSITDLKSLELSEEYIRPGKPFFIKNRTGHTVKLWHNSGAGNISFYFPNGSDLVVNPNEVIQFNLNANNSSDYKLEWVGNVLNLSNKADLVGGKVPASQLPSYVDDILEGYLLSNVFYAESGHVTVIPAEAGKIYIDITTGQKNKEYRYSGSVYVQITNGLIASTDDVVEGGTNKYSTLVLVMSYVLTGVSFASGTAITAADTILSAFGKLQKQITDISAIVTGILIPQITIATAVSITTATNDASGYGQKGRNVIISNGGTAINLTVNGPADFVASYVKHGSGAITFVQGSGRTLVQVDGTAVLNGAVGSTATISSVGTTDYLRISNA